MSYRRIITIIALSLLSLFCCLASACDGESSNGVSLTLNREEMTIEKYASGWLFSDYNGQEDVIWSSDNENVVKVLNGKVIGVGVGTAKVYAEAGTNKESCAVTVVPVDVTKIKMEVLSENVDAYVGDVVESPVVLKHNKTPIDYQFEYSSDSSIVEISNEGEIIAKAMGRAMINAQALLEGQNFEVNFEVNVVSDYEVVIENSKIVLYPFESFEGETYKNTISLNAKVLNKGSVTEFEQSVEWSLPENQDVACINGNVLTATNAGETQVTAKYVDSNGGESISSIKVTVLPVIATAKVDSVEIGMYNGYTPNMEQIIGASAVVTKATLKTKAGDIELEVNGGKITFDVSQILVTEAELSLVMRNYQCSVKAQLWGAIIKTPTDMEALKTATQGRYKLGANIDMSGISWVSDANFSGTFDGMGYVISNLSIGGASGLFKKISGTIKDVGFVNATVNNYQAGVLCYEAGDLIVDNVSVLMKASPKWGGGCLFRGGNSRKTIAMKDVLIVSPTLNSGAGFVSSIMNNTTLNFENCYFIAENGVLFDVSRGNTSNVVGQSGHTIYQSESDFTEDENKSLTSLMENILLL